MQTRAYMRTILPHGSLLSPGVGPSSSQSKMASKTRAGPKPYASASTSHLLRLSLTLCSPLPFEIFSPYRSDRSSAKRQHQLSITAACSYRHLHVSIIEKETNLLPDKSHYPSYLSPLIPIGILHPYSSCLITD